MFDMVPEDCTHGMYTEDLGVKLLRILIFPREHESSRPTLRVAHGCSFGAADEDYKVSQLTLADFSAPYSAPVLKDCPVVTPEVEVSSCLKGVTLPMRLLSYRSGVCRKSMLASHV